MLEALPALLGAWVVEEWLGQPGKSAPLLKAIAVLDVAYCCRRRRESLHLLLKCVRVDCLDVKRSPLDIIKWVADRGIVVSTLKIHALLTMSFIIVNELRPFVVPSVTTLIVSGNLSDSTHQLKRFTQLFPSLVGLDFQEAWGSGDSLPALLEDITLPIERLVLPQDHSFSPPLIVELLSVYCNTLVSLECGGLDDHSLLTLSARVRGLRHVKLNLCGCRRSAGLEAFLVANPKLISLCLHSQWRSGDGAEPANDALIGSVAASCRELFSVDLDISCTATYRCIPVLMSTCRHLRLISVAGVLVRIAESGGTCALAFSQSATAESAKSLLGAIPASISAFEWLVFGSVDEELLRLLTAQPLLRAKLLVDDGLCPAALEAFFKGSSGLTSLSLEVMHDGPPKESWRDLQQRLLAIPACLDDLEELSICDRYLPDETALAIVRELEGRDRLRVLRFDHCWMVSVAVAELAVAVLPSLQELGVFCTTAGNDDGSAMSAAAISLVRPPER